MEKTKLTSTVILSLVVLVSSKVLAKTDFETCGEAFFPQVVKSINGPLDFAWVYGSDLLTSKGPQGGTVIYTSSGALQVQGAKGNCGMDVNQTREKIIAGWISDATKENVSTEARNKIVQACADVKDDAIQNALTELKSKTHLTGGGSAGTSSR